MCNKRLSTIVYLFQNVRLFLGLPLLTSTSITIVFPRVSETEYLLKNFILRTINHAMSSEKEVLLSALWHSISSLTVFALCCACFWGSNNKGFCLFSSKKTKKVIFSLPGNSRVKKSSELITFTFPLSIYILEALCCSRGNNFLCSVFHPVTELFILQFQTFLFLFIKILFLKTVPI